MSQYSKAVGWKIAAFIALLSVLPFFPDATAGPGSATCARIRHSSYFVDSIQLPRALGTIYVGYPNDEASQPGGFLLLAQQDSCILMKDVITCDACIGRSTIGPTYKGASLRGNTLVLKQHTFDYDVEMYITITGVIPAYEKIIIKSLHNRCVRICIPGRRLLLTELGFMRLDLDDKSLRRHFKVLRKSC